MRKTKNVMKGLTAKEEEIMGFFWEKGPLFVKEMLAFYGQRGGFSQADTEERYQQIFQ